MKKSLVSIAIIAAIIAIIIAIELNSDSAKRARLNTGDTQLVVSDSLNTNNADTVFVDGEQQAAPAIDKSDLYPVAKDISGIEAFINTDPFTVQEMIDDDKVVLIDFWTYSCINCQRTIPHLNSWHEKYADDGLVIVGVHTPEFEFEKKLSNVKAAVKKWGIEYPVVLDNIKSTWASYQNQYWPRKYLIDIDGYIAYDHIGEGSYDITEAKIVEALNERKQRLGQPAISIKSGKVTDQTPERIARTHETYLGSKRIEYIGNLADQACLSAVCNYGWDETLQLPVDRYILLGQWEITPEYSVNTEAGAVLRSHFKAKRVNLVVANLDNPVTAEIYLDGELISNDVAGADVVDGLVTFNEDDLFNLVDFGDVQGQHILEIKPLTEGMQAFAFTFG